MDLCLQRDKCSIDRYLSGGRTVGRIGLDEKSRRNIILIAE